MTRHDTDRDTRGEGRLRVSFHCIYVQHRHYTLPQNYHPELSQWDNQGEGPGRRKQDRGLIVCIVYTPSGQNWVSGRSRPAAHPDVEEFVMCARRPSLVAERFRGCVL